MIQIQDFSFTYKNGENPALQEVSLTVPDGGFLGIIGPGNRRDYSASLSGRFLRKRDRERPGHGGFKDR